MVSLIAERMDALRVLCEKHHVKALYRSMTPRDVRLCLHDVSQAGARIRDLTSKAHGWQSVGFSTRLARTRRVEEYEFA